MFKQLPNGVLVNLDLVFAIKQSSNKLSFIDGSGRVMLAAEFPDEKSAKTFLDNLIKKK